MGLLKQSGFYLAARIVPAAIGAGAVAIYTRLLDPASIGSFALLLSTSMLLSGIGFTWLRIAALRVAAGAEDDFDPDFITTIGLLFLGTAALVAIVEGIVIHAFQPGISTASLVLAVAAAIASAWYDLNASLLQARLNVLAWGRLNLVRAIVAVAASVALIYAGFKTEALLGGFVLGNGATAMFMSIWRPAARGKFDKTLFARCFHFGWPQSVNAAQGYIAPVLQRWMLQFTVGAAAVGIFSVAQDFSGQTISSLVGSISLAGIPLAFKAKEKGDALALRSQLRANASLIFAIALPATVGFVILAEPIAHTFLGSRFWEGASFILAIAGLAAFAMNLRTYYFDQSFELSMETRPQAIISTLSTIIAVTMTLILVPRFAAAGAAVAALTASVVALTLSICWGRRTQPMPVPIGDWLRTGIATVGMAIALAFVPKDGGAAGLALATCAGAVVYVILASAMRLSRIRARIGTRLAWLQRS